MSESFQVETCNPELYFALRKVGERHGWSKPTRRSESYPWLAIYPEIREVTGNSTKQPHLTTISIEMVVKLLKKPPELKPICIDGNAVEFKLDGIKVGCVSVPTEIVDDIHTRLHEQD